MTTATYYSLIRWKTVLLTAPLQYKVFLLYVNKTLFVKCNIKVIVDLLLKIYECQLTQLSVKYVFGTGAPHL
jgi:hypothetical protein